MFIILILLLHIKREFISQEKNQFEELRAIYPPSQFPGGWLCNWFGEGVGPARYSVTN